MPPRTEVGLSRKHAALDAMRPMGFPNSVVRKCLNDLLKVYGKTGWAFIEADAYKVLIETILEELEKPPPEDDQKQPLAIEAGEDDKQPILLLEAPKSVEETGAGKRKPCHGWIGAEDDDDFVYLEPLDPHGFDYPCASGERFRSHKALRCLMSQDASAAKESRNLLLGCHSDSNPGIRWNLDIVDEERFYSNG